MFHPISGKMLKVSIVNLLRRNYRPISSSVSQMNSLWLCHTGVHEDKPSRSLVRGPRNSLAGLMLVRGAKGNAPSKKTSVKSPPPPPPPSAQDDTVCKGANVFKDGSDPPIEEDSEYPDWLWVLAEPKKSYQEYPVDSKEYWRRLRKQKAHERNIMMKQMGKV